MLGSWFFFTNGSDICSDHTVIPPFYKRRNLYKQTKKFHLHQTSSQMQWRQWAEWNQTKWPRKAAWFNSIFCSSTGGHNCRKWIQHQGALDQGPIWRYIKTSTAVCSRPPSKETNHFVIHSPQFLYFCAAYQKMPAMGSVFPTLPQYKNRVRNWESCWQDHPFLLEEALSLSFLSCKNLFKSWWVNLFQSISNR